MPGFNEGRASDTLKFWIVHDSPHVPPENTEWWSAWGRVAVRDGGELAV